MLYFREDIPSILLATEEKSYPEGFYVELNWRNNKWLINWSYDANKAMISSHDMMSKDLNLHSSIYEKSLMLGDLGTRNRVAAP